MEVEDTSSYGVVVPDADGRVRAFVEKPAPATTAAPTVHAGAYVIDAAEFDTFGGDGPLSFEYDVFPSLLANGAPGRVRGLALPATWQDLGTPERYRQGHALVLDGTCRWPMPPSVRMVAPGVAVHERATIATSAVLVPPVVVGADCSVARGAALEDVVLHDGASTGREAQVRSTIVGPAGVVADGAHVRGVVITGRATKGVTIA
ncbi:hypothetical protein BH23ACT10_BH23ACT10_36690 [soil metagenome]